jgi:hypothetical protein
LHGLASKIRIGGYNVDTNTDLIGKRFRICGEEFKSNPTSRP